ncbi:MAG: tRNA (adenosine(37)-N6)-dimethylallyltransferase MiaA [Myxococcales bacterium]|nr:tRNA (adenosine(37)-N6)-dimethylallyltransferase MiaA [Myxococcales bacterium]
MSSTSEEAQALPRALAITGPTASGKSRLGLEVAARFGLPILCCDSVQVYRGLDIGSAKPTAVERACAPHHLIDLVRPDEDYSAGDYGRDAHELLRASPRPGLFVGGTGFYLRAALVSQSGASAGADPQLADPKRAAFMDTWERREQDEPGAAHAELARVDPETARAVHPRNVVRAVRALWLCRVHGRPVSAVRREDPPRRLLSLLMIVLDPGVASVDAAIDRRCDNMLAAGWLAEVEKLVAAGYDDRHKAMRSLGYRQLLLHLRGELSLEEAVRTIKAETRRYARRQRTYLRHQLNAETIMTVHIESARSFPWGLAEEFVGGAS